MRDVAGHMSLPGCCSQADPHAACLQHPLTLATQHKLLWLLHQIQNNLLRSLPAGPIYCSPVTARVLRHDFGLRPDCLRVLAVDETVTIAGVSELARLYSGGNKACLPMVDRQWIMFGCASQLPHLCTPARRLK